MKKTLFVPILISLIWLFGCVEDLRKYDENRGLKTKLQGTWITVSGKDKHNNEIDYRELELTFIGNQLYWTDSTVDLSDSININGYIEVSKGNNPVAYAFNNGDTPISYGAALPAFFLDRPENDILWVDLGYKSYKLYALENDIATLEREHPISDVPTGNNPISSSSVVFRINNTEAEFWGPSFDRDARIYVFQKSQ